MTWSCSFSSRASTVLISHPPPDEFAGLRQRLAAIFELRIPDVPGVDHMRPDLQRDRNVGRGHGGGKPRRIVKQRLGRTDLDQARRETTKIGEQWRNQRVL